MRACDYYDEFEKEKICFSKASKIQSFCIDKNQNYLLNTSYYLSHDNSNYYLLSILNSKLARFSFLKFYQSGGIFGEITLQGIMEFPVIKINDIQQLYLNKLIEYILRKKENNENTSKEEREIDIMVYKLYELTYYEVKTVDPEFDMSEEEYEKYEVEE